VTFRLSGAETFSSDKELVYSLEYYVPVYKLKIRTLIYVYFFLWSLAAFINLFQNLLSVMWRFKKQFVITVAGRWLGSGFATKSFRSGTLVIVGPSSSARDQEINLPVIITASCFLQNGTSQTYLQTDL
jgi:hypothetical protein